jgi:hypothetical protein
MFDSSDNMTQESQILQTGEWKISVRIDDNLMEHSFTVIPSKDEFNKGLESNLEIQNYYWDKHWLFDSICAIDLSNRFSFKPCKEVKWSSYYPDPKSDLIKKIEEENKSGDDFHIEL